MRNSILWFIIIITACMWLLSSCLLKDWCLFECQPCEIDLGDCECKPDTITYHCPPGTVHGEYNYGGWFRPTCSCNCEQGWAGSLCDQRDTSYFVIFLHGSDTATLSEIKTSYTEAGLAGIFPSGSTINKVRVGGLPFLWEKGTYQLCGWGCPFIEIIFSDGDTAASLSGAMIVDSASNSLFSPRFFRGTFNSNLYVKRTGQIYYVREGVFTLF